VDVIVDSVGGSNFKKDLNILQANGRVIGIGVSTATDRSFPNVLSLVPQVISMQTLPGIELLLNSKGFYGVNMKRLGDMKPKLLELILTQLMKLFAEGVIVAEPPQEYPWTEIGKAHDFLESRKSTGKLVGIIPEDDASTVKK